MALEHAAVPNPNKVLLVMGSDSDMPLKYMFLPHIGQPQKRKLWQKMRQQTVLPQLLQQRAVLRTWRVLLLRKPLCRLLAYP